jgi:hypothetical protein
VAVENALTMADFPMEHQLQMVDFFFLPPLIAGASPIVLRGKAEFQHISK